MLMILLLPAARDAGVTNLCGRDPRRFELRGRRFFIFDTSRAAFFYF
jgi:hypothetical protein